ncbi:hypothetical protein LCGC14_1009970 [marine sediment metagenome]|uniref:Uncharacterized protein n=1 Tax=marine sediment metagenome TaxID=412755 RepID=A0A0F9R6L5_9ZZZZ
MLLVKENEMNNSWWKEYDFDFEGTPCTYYIWPNDRGVCFGERHDEILVPTFDLRYVGMSLEACMKETIQDHKKNWPNLDVYCNIVRYKGCSTCIGILCIHKKVAPTTEFAPYDNECIDCKEHIILRTDKWKIMHPSLFAGADALEDLEQFKTKVLSRQLLIDDLLKFEKSLEKSLEK